MLNTFYIDQVIRQALLEDVPYLDVATDYCFDDTHRSAAYYVAKDEGVLAGVGAARRVFELLDDTVCFETKLGDGSRVKKGDVIALFEGRTNALLKGERTSLNIMQHMSGIATETARCVALIEGTGVTVCETRKTLPGLRPLQKYAVLCGGGRNHRYGLSDACILKDNHIDALGGILPAVRAVRDKAGHMMKVEVEVRNFDELEQALEAGADVIMLDNMSCGDMQKAVGINAGRAVLEASGNITDQTIRLVASTGVDIISIGALTHTVKAFDISMKIK